MKKLLSVIAGFVLGLALVMPAAHAADKGLIGISMPTKSSARWISDGASMVKYFKEKGYTPDLQYADDDIPNQLAQIENMITKGSKVLIIAAIDGTTLSGALQKAADKGIKVIAYDRLIRGSKNVDYYTTFDNFQVGVLQAQSLEKALGLKEGKGPFNIELFGGSADDNNAFFFYDGAMSVLQHTDLEVVEGGVVIHIFAAHNQAVVGHDLDALVGCFLQRVGQGGAVDGSNHQHFDALGDHVLDLRQLVGDVVVRVLQIGLVTLGGQRGHHAVAVADPAGRSLGGHGHAHRALVLGLGHRGNKRKTKCQTGGQRLECVSASVHCLSPVCVGVLFAPVGQRCCII